MKSKLLLLICCLLVLLKLNAQRPFITTWNTRNTGISDSTHIIFYATGDNFQISWINTSNASDTGNAVGVNGADTISFPAPGTYKVYMSPGSGSFSAVTQNIENDSTNSDCNRLTSIEQWGDINWSTFNTAFANCYSMVMNAPDVPNLSNVTDMSNAFYRCFSLTTNDAMSNWDVSNVKDMSGMFNGAIDFNQSIGSWDVSNVTDMSFMLASTIAFNQPIGNWNVSNVKSMYATFYNTQSFNQPIGNWDVSNVTDMSDMLGASFNFDQPIGNWNVSSVTNMRYMFAGAENFNQPIENWNVGRVINMFGMFESASSFNQPIGNWDVGNVTNMSFMFLNAYSFNQPIGNWNVGNVTNMSEMFEDAQNFNQPIGDWNVGKVTNMEEMFLRENSFNQPIDKWNVSTVQNMFGMFDGASSFDQPIDDWDVSNAKNMDLMFANASNFNQPIGNWKVNNVNQMFGMFSYANNFNQPIGNWDIHNVTDIKEMFSNATSFNQSLNNWDVSNVIDMSKMFSNAKNFNQSLGSWKLNSLEYKPVDLSIFSALNMFDSCGMDCNNYSKTLKGWAENSSIAKNQFLGAANITYDSAFAKAAHDSLINIKGWTITGDSVGHCSGILPVNFISFTAIQQSNKALLNWYVTNEINPKVYAIEKDEKGFNFNSIGFVTATNSKQTHYTFTDNNLSEGISYYRIKEVDNDGKYLYSSVQKVEYSKFAWKVYGNPISNSSIALMLNKPANTSVQVISATGNIVKTINKGNLTTGNYNIPLNINNIGAGLYIIRLTVDDKTYTSTIVKQ